MDARVTEMISRLTDYKWFRAVGQPVEQADVLVRGSWKEALQDDGSDVWGNVRLKAANGMRTSAKASDVNRYRAWNDKAKEIRPLALPLVKAKVLEAIPDHPRLAVITDLAQWDIVHVLLQQEYGDLIPTGFYHDIGFWYSEGHFPCDWVGEFPEGKLVIY